jgi:WYL domain
MPIEAMFDLDAPSLTFTYQDAKGQVSDRTVQPLGVIEMKSGNPGIRALCELRGALRTFETHSILQVRGIDGQLATKGWEDLETVIAEPNARLFLARRYTYDVAAGLGRAAPAEMGDPIIQAQVVLEEVNKSLQMAVAWRDKSGRPRLDIDANAAGALMVGSAHLAMRRRGALFLAGAALLEHAPDHSPYVAWHKGCAAWYDTGAQRWMPFPPSS